MHWCSPRNFWHVQVSSYSTSFCLILLSLDYCNTVSFVLSLGDNLIACQWLVMCVHVIWCCCWQVAESEQSTFTDLVKQLTANCISDLQKARCVNLFP